MVTLIFSKYLLLKFENDIIVGCSNENQVKLAKLCTTSFGKMLAAPFAIDDESHVTIFVFFLRF